jgi:hypothetical protein
MQKSSKITWTIVTLLVGGILLYNLNTTRMVTKVGALISLVMIVVIAAIWRLKAKKMNSFNPMKRWRRI